MSARHRGAKTAALLAALAAVGALVLWRALPAPPQATPRGALAPAPAPEAARADVAPSSGTPSVASPSPRGDAPGPPAPPPLVGPAGEPTPALVRSALEAALARHDPSLKLSREELDAAADALWRLREARLELARLGDDPGHAARRAALREAVAEATAEFTYHVEMSPAAFTALATPDEGLDAPAPVVER